MNKLNFGVLNKNDLDDINFNIIIKYSELENICEELFNEIQKFIDTNLDQTQLEKIKWYSFYMKINIYTKIKINNLRLV